MWPRPVALVPSPVAEDVVKKHLTQDAVSGKRAEYREHPGPTFVTHGPKTRREFLTTGASGIGMLDQFFRRPAFR